MPDGINSFKTILDTIETVFNMLLSVENVAKNFMVESDRILTYTWCQLIILYKYLIVYNLHEFEVDINFKNLPQKNQL